MQFLRGTHLRSRLKKTFVNEIVHQLVSICLIPSHVELPARQQGAVWITETEAVTFQNGVINLRTALGGPVELMPHSWVSAYSVG